MRSVCSGAPVLDASELRRGVDPDTDEVLDVAVID